MRLAPHALRNHCSGPERDHAVGSLNATGLSIGGKTGAFRDDNYLLYPLAIQIDPRLVQSSIILRGCLTLQTLAGTPAALRRKSHTRCRSASRSRGPFTSTCGHLCF
jgi:hypothetical protein